jgi:hypothetical protein
MDPITIIAIIIGLLLAAAFTFIEDAFNKMLSPIFRLIGLQSSSGPMDITLKQKDKSIELHIANNGKGKAKMAAIQIIDRDGKKSFPIPFAFEADVGEEISEKKTKEYRKLFFSNKIEQGGELTIFLNPNELEECNLSTLGVLDIDGKFWQATAV